MNRNKYNTLGVHLYDYIGDATFNYYLEEWAKVPKISQEQFLLNIIDDDDLRNYYISKRDMLNHYEEYLNGAVSARYPKLPTHPADVFKEVVKYVDGIFDTHENYPDIPNSY